MTLDLAVVSPLNPLWALEFIGSVLIVVVSEPPWLPAVSLMTVVISMSRSFSAFCVLGTSMDTEGIYLTRQSLHQEGLSIREGKTHTT